MSKLTLKGSCLCGTVQYEVSGDPLRFSHCHCGRCRKATGTGHSTNIMIKSDCFEWLEGETSLRRYKVPEAERYYTHFCARCGSPMPRDIPELGMVAIPAGSLDHDIELKPGMHIFWDSRASWSCGGDELPVYAQYPTQDSP